MSPLTVTNPYLRGARDLRRTLREDARQSSIFEGAHIPAGAVTHAPDSIRRRTAVSKKSANGR
jgi:hypothetical protein